MNALCEFEDLCHTSHAWGPCCKLKSNVEKMTHESWDVAPSHGWNEGHWLLRPVCGKGQLFPNLAEAKKKHWPLFLSNVL